MKKVLFLTVLFLLALSGLEWANAQDYFQDTVWTKKTDQSAGMFQVKFSNNDSIIWAMGLENGLFFDTFSGEEIRRIPGNNEVFFINNDRSLIRLNTARTKFEVFDTQTFQIIDSLENDGTVINEYPKCDISYDEQYLIAPVPRGFRIWDLNSKNILKTKIFPEEPNLIDAGVANLRFICNTNKIIGQFAKTYYNPDNPNNPITVGNFTVYDFLTLDSIDSYKNCRGFVLSKTCRYIAYGTGDPSYGVEVYDFNTKDLLWKLPINGPSLTGIEFSPDDKYLVTSPRIQIWDIENKQLVYSYQSGSSGNISISHDGKYIISSIDRYLYNWFARWNGINVEEKVVYPIIIYPNPTNGMVTINFTLQLPEITNINLMDINGEQIRNLFNNLLEPGQQEFNFDINDLANGEYFINVNNSYLSLFFKLIINR